MTPEQEMAAEPGTQSVLTMYSPKSFRPSCLRTPSQGHLSEVTSRDLDPKWWQDTQRSIKDGHLMDFFPYRADHRKPLLGPPLIRFELINLVTEGVDPLRLKQHEHG